MPTVPEHDEGDLLAEASRDHGGTTDHFHAAGAGSGGAALLASALVGALGLMRYLARPHAVTVCEECGRPTTGGTCLHGA